MSKQTSRCRVLCSWAAVVLWMGLIFYLSSQVAEQSNELSMGVTEKIVENVGKVVPQAELDLFEWNHLIRKKAHFSLYFLLGIFVTTAWRSMGVTGKKGFWYALFVCVLFAIGDETRQLFVPGRGGQMSDVMIDSAGALLGIGLVNGIVRLIRNRKRSTTTSTNGGAST